VLRDLPSEVFRPLIESFREEWHERTDRTAFHMLRILAELVPDTLQDQVTSILEERRTPFAPEQVNGLLAALDLIGPAAAVVARTVVRAALTRRLADTDESTFRHLLAACAGCHLDILEDILREAIDADVEEEQARLEDEGEPEDDEPDPEAEAEAGRGMISALREAYRIVTGGQPYLDYFLEQWWRRASSIRASRPAQGMVSGFLSAATTCPPSLRPRVLDVALVRAMVRPGAGWSRGTPVRPKDETAVKKAEQA